MKIFDFECPKCNVRKEIFVLFDEEEVICKACNVRMEKILSAPKVFTAIIPTYPGSQRRKAGYAHKHVNRPATKTQVGCGGGLSPEHPKK